MGNSEKFNYTYSGKEQEEIRKIRGKYVRQDTQTDKMEQLRRLDAGVAKKGAAVSLVIGIAGTLIMGTGMSFVMSDFGKIFGSFSDFALPLGIILGIAGMILIVLAYPVYNRVTAKERERITPEILRLTDELMK